MDLWKPSFWYERNFPMVSEIEVDNRIFVLGLDNLYRTAMKEYESQTLLPSARVVAQRLRVQRADVPIEGYYHETDQLTEYFQLMRSLQEVGEDRESEVKNLQEFQMIWDLTNSPLYGRPQRMGHLLPAGRDPLSQALLDTRPTWNVERLAQAAYEASIQYDDISLVGLAARTQDAVILAAVRESAVLYAEVMSFGIHVEPEFSFKWCVDDELAAAANRFIETFNRFVPGALPEAEAGNAEKFYQGFKDNDVIGRCVRIGKGSGGSPFYHWAISTRNIPGNQVELEIDEFWSTNIWTTEKYRSYQNWSDGMKLFKESGVPEDEWRML